MINNSPLKIISENIKSDIHQIQISHDYGGDFIFMHYFDVKQNLNNVTIQLRHYSVIDQRDYVNSTTIEALRDLYLDMEERCGLQLLYKDI